MASHVLTAAPSPWASDRRMAAARKDAGVEKRISRRAVSRDRLQWKRHNGFRERLTGLVARQPRSDVHAQSLQQLQQPTAPIHDTWNIRNPNCEREDQEWDCDAGEHGRGEVAAGAAVAQHIAQ
jgi:hypothetical protein